MASDFQTGMARMQRALAAEEERRADRRARRRKERRARRRRGSAAGLLAGAVALTVIVVNGAPYWLMFIAVWLAVMAGSRLLGARQAEGADEATAETATAAVDARMARVDALCDQLLADIRSAPPILREIVQRPEETVRALRDGVHALERRERELRGLIRPEDEARLESEREALQRRLDEEKDEVTRQRLAQALDALDRQRSSRSSLVTAASRLEAERTRLLYTLEGLHAQVLSVRSTAAAGQDAAAVQQLRESLDTLSDEVSAVAGALESVQAVDPGAVTPATSSERSSLPERSG